jgi:hypothetical protein
VTTALKVICLMYIVSKETKSNQTVKLTPVIGINPYRRDMQTSVHRNRPNRPHISSDTNHVKEQETNIPRCAIHKRRAPPNLPQFRPASVANQPVQRPNTASPPCR